MVVSIKKLSEMAVIPKRGSDYAAGYDLCAAIAEEWNLLPHETKLVPTGLAVAIPSGYFGGVFARSGLASKEGLRPANCVGVIDADYRGEVMVSLHNDGEQMKTIVPGQRIAQLVILPFLEAVFQEEDELTETNRGDAGFGSTGKI